MEGIRIIHMSIGDIDFKCPHCMEKYSDENDVFLKKCNKNKSMYTKIKCECGETFGMAFDYKGDAVGFELK